MFPKPECATAPPQVSDFKVQVVPCSVVLSWKPINPGTAGRLSYAITKSEVKWENRNCLECPAPDQQRVQNIDAASVKPDADGKVRWTDTNVSYLRAFRYQVILLDENGNTVTSSGPAIARVYPGPATPINVTATAQPKGILIQWQPVLKDIEGKKLDSAAVSFVVERLLGDKSWEKVSPSAVKGDVFYDQTVAAGQSYSYRVIPALFIDGAYVYGHPSSVVLANGPESVDTPPPGKVWVTPAHGALEIHWTEVDGQTGGYYVYRKKGKDDYTRLTANPVKHPPFVDRSAQKGATYSYAVSTVSSRGDHKEGLASKWVEVRNLLGD